MCCSEMIKDILIVLDLSVNKLLQCFVLISTSYSVRIFIFALHILWAKQFMMTSILTNLWPWPSDSRWPRRGKVFHKYTVLLINYCCLIFRKRKSFELFWKLAINRYTFICRTEHLWKILTRNRRMFMCFYSTVGDGWDTVMGLIC